MDAGNFKKEFDSALDKLSQELYCNESFLDKACRYALAGDGKRVRPFLLQLSSQIWSHNFAAVLQAGLAIELIHTYSLVHDDLPCMDNDTMRRGRETVHVKFDEATALLTGDALLTDAFRILSSRQPHQFCSALPKTSALNPSCQLRMIETLSQCAGGSGMVLGQACDLYWTTRGGYTHEILDQIHRNKTGRLIAASCVLGGLCAGIEDELTLNSLCTFGELIGVVFQIKDDLLDSSNTMGKSQNKDIEQGKLTYLTLMPKEEAEKVAALLTTKARNLILPFGPKAEPLIKYAETLLNRTH